METERISQLETAFRSHYQIVLEQVLLKPSSEVDGKEFSWANIDDLSAFIESHSGAGLTQAYPQFLLPEEAKENLFGEYYRKRIQDFDDPPTGDDVCAYVRSEFPNLFLAESVRLGVAAGGPEDWQNLIAPGGGATYFICDSPVEPPRPAWSFSEESVATRQNTYWPTLKTSDFVFRLEGNNRQNARTVLGWPRNQSSLHEAIISARAAAGAQSGVRGTICEALTVIPREQSSSENPSFGGFKTYCVTAEVDGAVQVGTPNLQIRQGRPSQTLQAGDKVRLRFEVDVPNYIGNPGGGTSPLQITDARVRIVPANLPTSSYGFEVQNASGHAQLNAQGDEIELSGRNSIFFNLMFEIPENYSTTSESIRFELLLNSLPTPVAVDILDFDLESGPELEMRVSGQPSQTADEWLFTSVVLRSLHSSEVLEVLAPGDVGRIEVTFINRGREDLTVTFPFQEQNLFSFDDCDAVNDAQRAKQASCGQPESDAYDCSIWSEALFVRDRATCLNEIQRASCPSFSSARTYDDACRPARSAGGGFDPATGTSATMPETFTLQAQFIGGKWRSNPETIYAYFKAPSDPTAHPDCHNKGAYHECSSNITTQSNDADEATTQVKLVGRVWGSLGMKVRRDGAQGQLLPNDRPTFADVGPLSVGQTSFVNDGTGRVECPTGYHEEELKIENLNPWRTSFEVDYVFDPFVWLNHDQGLRLPARFPAVGIDSGDTLTVRVCILPQGVSEDFRQGIVIRQRSMPYNIVYLDYTWSGISPLRVRHRSSPTAPFVDLDATNTISVGTVSGQTPLSLGELLVENQTKPERPLRVAAVSQWTIDLNQLSVPTNDPRAGVYHELDFGDVKSVDVSFDDMVTQGSTVTGEVLWFYQKNFPSQEYFEESIDVRFHVS